MTRHMPDVYGKIAEIAVDRPELAAKLYQAYEATKDGDSSAKVAWEWERSRDPYPGSYQYWVDNGGDPDSNDWLNYLCYDD